MAKSILFATGNPHKLQEVQAILPVEVRQLDVDLPELQSMDLKEIVTAKLASAFAQSQQPVMVEDVAAELDALHGFPGPFVKFANTAMGQDALYQMVLGHDNKRVKIVALIGYHDGQEMHFFEGSYYGTVVAPRGNHGFGFDPVVMPDGETKSIAEMSADKKNAISHRARALKAFAEFLSN